MKKAIIFFMSMGVLNKVLATNQYGNLIFNGDFTQNDCDSDWCIFNQTDAVKGWFPEPEFEIGYGQVYSDFLTNERVLELAPNANTCVMQIIKNIQLGQYQLRFDWGARKGRPFSDSQFSVSLGEFFYKKFFPQDYRIKTQTINFDFDREGDVNLRFCAIGGNNNGYGAFVKSIFLVKKPVTLSIQYMPQPTSQFPRINQVQKNPLVQSPRVFNPFNIRLPSIIFQPSGFSLDSQKLQCYARQYQLQVGGEILIVFDFKVSSNFMIRDSAVIVTWNGQPIYKILPFENGETIRLKINTLQGSYKVQFCPTAGLGQISHKTEIRNVAIYEQQCMGEWGNDLISNGGFQQNSCEEQFCIWNQSNFQATSVPNWQPSPQIQIGRGRIYNSVWGQSWVAQLETNTNTCIGQRVALRPGRIILEFDWTGRVGSTFESNRFEFKINGQVFKSYQPIDGNLNKQRVEFDVSQCPKEAWIGNQMIGFDVSQCPTEWWIEFCGSHPSEGLGALVDNIRLYNWQPCATMQLIKY